MDCERKNRALQHYLLTKKILCRYTTILAIYEVAFVILDRKDCALVGLRQTVGVLAIITLCLQLYLLLGQVLLKLIFS